MKKLGKWVIWIVILEFLFFFALGTRIRRQWETPTMHFVASPAPAPAETYDA